MQSHREYQIVTPRTLASFRGKNLILPDVRILSSEETAALRKYAGSVGKIVATGALSEGLQGETNLVHVADSPGARYIALAESHFDDCSPNSEKLFLDSLGGGEEMAPQVGLEPTTLRLTAGEHMLEYTYSQ
jgi:hypothetical protein